MRRTKAIELLAAIAYVSVGIPADAKGKPLTDCTGCDHKKFPEGGHCYMFRTQPSGHCMQYKETKKKQ